MKVKVELLAFSDGKIREVDVKENATLDDIFYYGQNDIQMKDKPSVSSGDIIHLDNKKYLIMAVGFRELTEQEYLDYKNKSNRERIMSHLLEKI